MNIVVQKFGGTSVSTKDKRQKIIGKVKKAIDDKKAVIVVVSAMGRQADVYSTDALLSLVSKNCNKVSRDLLISCGEIITAVLLSDELEKEGVSAIPLTGGQAGIITDKNFGNAKMIEFNKEVIRNLLNENKTPIVCGFQGMTKEGDFTTLGRGGSDTTAAILGSELDAERIEIYTDVDGIMTADPRIVKKANLIKTISYEEVFQLADQGAKVIHPKAIIYASSKNIPIYIKNTLNDCEGTVIKNIRSINNKLITSITSHNDRIQVILKQEENNLNDNYNKALQFIAAENISLDLINICPDRQVFTISKKDEEKILALFKSLSIKYELLTNCSKIALVGLGMKGIPGVMAQIYKSLNERNITVLQTADSHMTIWCLIYEKDLEDAINILHKSFEL